MVTAWREQEEALCFSPGVILLTVSSNAAGLRSVEDIALVYAAGTDPYALLEEMVLFALEASGKSTYDVPISHFRRFSENGDGVPGILLDRM